MINRLLKHEGLEDREGIDAICLCDFPSSSSYRIFAQKDQTLYVRHFGISEGEASDICLSARKLARSLFSCPHPYFASDLAGRWNIQVCREESSSAVGNLVFLGECYRRPPRIVLYRNAVAEASAGLEEWGGVPDLKGSWFDTVENIVVAHELYHLFSQASWGRKTELAAHSFARELMGLPFSPLLIESALRRRKGNASRARS